MRIKLVIFIMIVISILVIPVYGGFYYDDTLDRVVDEADLLTDEEEEYLRSEIDWMDRMYDVVIVTTNTLGGKSPMEYADDYYDYNGYGIGESRDGLLFLLSMEDRDWWISTTGHAIYYFYDSTIDYIGELMLDDLGAGKYFDAFRNFLTLTHSYYGENLDETLNNVPEEVQLLFADSADVFTYPEEVMLMDKMRAIKSKNNLGVAVVTIDSSVDNTPEDFTDADEWYDDGKGALFLIDAADSKMYIYSAGDGKAVFNNYGTEYIINQAIYYISMGNYYQGVDRALYFADLFLEQAAEGDPFDYDNEFKYKIYKPPISEAMGYIGISALAALILAFIVVSVMKNGMNTIRSQRSADSYIIKDSLKVLNARDSFLYSKTTKTRRQSDSSSSGGGGGGSTTHQSSSGTSHGGGGGKF